MPIELQHNTKKMIDIKERKNKSDKIDNFKEKRVKVYQSVIKGEVDNSNDREQKQSLLSDAIKSFVADFLLDDKRFDVFDVSNAINQLNNEYGIYSFELDNHK